MIVFDLQCPTGHVFEAWFGSSLDYESQRERALIACPLCGQTEVAKAVMAPAVPAKSNQSADMKLPVSNRGAPDAGDLAKLRAVMARLARAQGEALKDAEWVGRQFAETARAIHYGEQDHKNIYGEVASEEARALIEEGVEVAPLLFPVAPPEQRN